MNYPFTPALLDGLPEEIAELYRGLEDRLLVEIVSRLRVSDELNQVAVEAIRALRSHGIPLDEIQTAIRDTAAVSKKTLSGLLADVVSRNEKYYSGVADLAGITKPDRWLGQDTIDAITTQTHGELKNQTGSFGFVVRRTGQPNRYLRPAKAYQWALDQAELSVQSGVVSYNAAIAKCAKELADSGLRVIRYDSNGRTRYDHADVAARRAVMTGVNQLCQQYATAAADRLGTDLVEVTAHAGARPSHAEWQGKIYRWRR